MMTRKSYKAFTFVEMLIVMGILIILMVIGITAGRYAINRANRVAHQNAADQIYQTLQAYYTENRQFPELDLLENMLSEEGALFEYSEGDFKGGAPATYHYFAQTGVIRQAVLVCVTLGGYDDELERGIYCTGNGFGSADVEIGSETVTAAGLTHDFFEEGTFEGEGVTNYYTVIKGLEGSDWDGNAWTTNTGGGGGE